MTWRPDYVSLADARDDARIRDPDDTVDDAALARWITAASRAVDKNTHRQFGFDTVQRFYDVEWRTDRTAVHGFGRRAGFITPGTSGGGYWWAPIDDLTVTDATKVQVIDNNMTTLTGWTLEPRNAVADGRPYEWIRLARGFYAPADQEIAITPGAGNMFGRPAVPAGVAAATLLQIARFAFRRESPAGVAGSPSDGSEVRLLARVDPDVSVMLDPFRREVWAA